MGNVSLNLSHLTAKEQKAKLLWLEWHLLSVYIHLCFYSLNNASRTPLLLPFIFSKFLSVVTLSHWMCQSSSAGHAKNDLSSLFSLSKRPLWLSDFIEIHLPVSFTLCGSHRRVRYLSEMKPDIPFFFLSVYSPASTSTGPVMCRSLTALGKSQLVWFDKELVVSLTHTRSTALHLLILPHLHRLDFHLSLKTCLQQVAFFSRNTLPSRVLSECVKCFYMGQHSYTAVLMGIAL